MAAEAEGACGEVVGSGSGVLFINRFYWPDEAATALMLTDLATDLARRGVAVAVLTSYARYTGSGAAGELPRLERAAGVEVVRVWSTRFGQRNLVLRTVDYLSFYLSAAVALLRRGRGAGVIVAMTDPPLLGVLAAAVGWCSRVPVIQWCQDVFPEMAFAGSDRAVWAPPRALLAALRDWSLRRSWRVVAPGEEMAAHLRLSSGREAGSRLVVLRNWADTAAVRPVPEEENPRRAEWGLDGCFVVGYSGNLGRAHDFSTALESAAELVADGSGDVRFLFVGGGAGNLRLRRALRPELASRFSFVPYEPRETLALALSAPDVHWFSLDPRFRRFVFPSKLYGILAAGRPCLFVGEPGSEIARWVEGEGVGYAVAPGDGAGFARRVRQLRDDAPARAAMGQRARAVAEAKGSLDPVAEKWLNLLRDGNR